MNPAYTRQQIVFTLNSIANTPSDRHGTARELEDYAKSVIAEAFADPGAIALIGEWDLAWGPRVFQAQDSSVADNAMYIARSKSDSAQIVVAISGTNPISAYGWIIEDFLINPTMQWPYNPQGGKITHGTYKGIGNLLGMVDGGKTLLGYLEDQVSRSDKPLSITVTGHSLGGALSPAVALMLQDTQGKANGWDPESKSSISVLPSAGPTPGDVTWRDYYDKQLGGRTDRLWNAIDVVPHAWQISMLEAVPTLYAPQIPENKYIDNLINLAVANSENAGDIQQIRPDVAGLPGKFDASATLSIRNLVELLETLLADKVIDRLASHLTPDELAILKALIDALIRYLNEQVDQDVAIKLDDLFKDIPLSGFFAQELMQNSVLELLNFIIQLAYQHTSAYALLLGTTAFSDIVGAIKSRLK